MKYETLCKGCDEQPDCRTNPMYNACPHMAALVSGTILPISSTVFCDTP